jgi:hypothetical protein
MGAILEVKVLPQADHSERIAFLPNGRSRLMSERTTVEAGARSQQRP